MRPGASLAISFAARVSPMVVAVPHLEEWDFMPLEVQGGQVAVNCGPGTFARWIIGTGSYVLQGDPVLELCPPGANESVTCLAEASGYVVAQQAVGVDDVIADAVPDGVLALIEESVVREDDSVPVKCSAGAIFESFLVDLGDIIHPGDAVALALPSGDTLGIHCRTAVGGRVVALKDDLREDMEVSAASPDLVVAYIGPPFQYPPDQQPKSSSTTLTSAASVGNTEIEDAAHGWAPSASPGAEGAGAAGALGGAAAERRLYLARGGGGHQACNSQQSLSTSTTWTSITTQGTTTTFTEWRSTSTNTTRPSFTTKARYASTNTTRTATTTTGYVTEIVFNGTFSEVLPTDEAKALFVSMLREKYEGYGLKQVVDLRPGSIIAELLFDDPVDLGVVEGAGCIMVDEKAICPKGSEKNNPLLRMGGGKPSRPAPPGRHGGFIGLVWLSTAIVLISCLGLFGMCFRPQEKVYQEVPSEDTWTDGGVVVEFQDQYGCKQTKTFYYCQHGMGLTRHEPISVDHFVEPNSYARELGVKVKWAIMKVGDKCFTKQSNYSEVEHALRQKLRSLPHYPLRIEFNTSDHTSESVLFEQRELGMEVGHDPPFKVEHVLPGGYAHKMCVKEGWTVTRVGNESVTHGTPPEKVHAWLEDATAALPQVADGLQIDCEDEGGNPHVIILDHHGHGINLEKDTNGSMKVGSFKCCSYAQRKGVKQNWKVTKIDSQAIEAKDIPQEVERRIHEGTKDYRVWPLKVTFETGHGAHPLSIYFEKQPLGIDWTETAPFKVRELHVDSYAARRGVQVGWVVARVGSEEVKRTTELNDLLRYIDDGTDHLPQEANGLRIDFLDRGRLRTCYFPRYPLGMELTTHLPVAVKSFGFNSYAKQRGVREHWQLVRIHTDEVQHRDDHKIVESLIQKHSEIMELQAWPLRMEFDVGGGATRIIYFDKQPLGLELTRTTPFKVAHFTPDSYARDVKGVKENWEVKRIGNVRIHEGTQRLHVEEMLAQGSAHLPQEAGALRVDFNTCGHSKSIWFRRKPLGITVTEGLKVEKLGFNSYAKTLGVQSNWTITRVGHDHLSHSSPPREVNEMLHQLADSLEPWPLRVEFDIGHGDTRTMYLDRRDLGIKFTEHSPLTVQSFFPDSYAEDLGVKRGWIVVQVGDEDVRGSSCEHVRSFLDLGLAHLQMDSQGLKVEFDCRDGTRLREVFFKYCPHGIVFSTDTPIHVKGFEFNSYGQTLGIQADWIVRRIGKQEVTNRHSQAEVLQSWSERELAFGLSHWPLRITFNTEKLPAFWGGCGRSSPMVATPESLVTLPFDTQPLGIVFQGQMPLRVARVERQSHDGDASSLGVSKDWVITKIGDERVTAKTFEHTLKVLRQGLQPLRYVGDEPRPPGVWKRDRRTWAC